MPIVVNSEYGTVRFPDGTDPETMRKAMTEFEGQKREEQASAGLKDVGKSFGRGVAKGAIGLAGLPGDLASLMNKGINTVESAIGIEPGEYNPDFGTSAQLERGVESVAGPFGKPETKAGEYAQSVGEMVPSSFIGPGGLALKAGGALASGAASQLFGDVAKEVAPEYEGLARAAGGLAGGLGAGITSAERSAAAGRRALYSQPEIKAASKADYQAVENSRYPIITGSGPNTVITMSRTIPRSHVQGLARALWGDVRRQNFSEVSAPATWRMLNNHLGRRPVTMADLLHFHNDLGNIVEGAHFSGADEMAASQMRENIRSFIGNLTGLGPTMQRAMRNWGMSEKLKEIDKSLQIAEHRASVSGTGSNVQNTMRQEVRKILDSDKRIRGYPPEIRQQMERIVSGTWAENASRYIGRFAPTGLHSSAAYAIMAKLWEAPIAVGTAATGYAFKKLGDFLTHREIERLTEMLQENAPINAALARINAGKRAQAQRGRRGATVRGAVGGSTDEREQPTKITVHATHYDDGGVPDALEFAQ